LVLNLGFYSGNETASAQMPISSFQSRIIVDAVQNLDSLESQLNQLILTYTIQGPLQFACSPVKSGPFQPFVELSGNKGPHCLVICQQNRSFLECQASLNQLLLDVEKIKNFHLPNLQTKCAELLQRVNEEFMKLDQFKGAEWETQRLKPFDNSLSYIIDTSESYNPLHWQIANIQF
jgi:hypothetical protein